MYSEHDISMLKLEEDILLVARDCLRLFYPKCNLDPFLFQPLYIRVVGVMELHAILLLCVVKWRIGFNVDADDRDDNGW